MLSSDGIPPPFFLSTGIEDLSQEGNQPEFFQATQKGSPTFLPKEMEDTASRMERIKG